MNVRVIAVRAAGVGALGTLSALLLMQAAPVDAISRAVGFAPTPALLATLCVLVFVPAAFARASPLPAALAVLVPILALAAYDASRLDWMRLLKDFGLTGSSDPNLARLGLSLAALLVAWTLHTLDAAMRLAARARNRGIEAPHANAAARVVRARAATRAGIAMLATALLGGAAMLGDVLGLDRILAGRGAFAAPLLAALLVATAAALVARGDAPEDGETRA